MSIMIKKIALLAICCLLFSCGKFRESEEISDEIEETTTSTFSPATPDIGRVQQVETTSQGLGVTPGAALNEALKMAIMQVNGTAVYSYSQNVDYYQKLTAQIDVKTKKTKEKVDVKALVQGPGFQNQIITESGGLVTGFKVVEIIVPKKEGENYSVTIEARIAQFRPPENQKIKIIVGPITSPKDVFVVAGQNVAAREVLNSIRQQMIDALTNTGRFTVLDRQFDHAREAEFSRIMEGRSNQLELTKIQQEWSADLIWTAQINDLAYQKNEGRLSASQRMINLSTSEILLASTFDESIPKVSSNESYTILNAIKQTFVKKTTDGILLKMFPISIIKIDDKIVRLNQGEGVLEPNKRYRVYLLGEELFDTQTKTSLGYDERLCCEVVITRVQPKFSEGVLENIGISLAGVEPGKLQLREALAPIKDAATDSESASATSQKKKKTSGGKKADTVFPPNRTLSSPDSDKDW